MIRYHFKLYFVWETRMISQTTGRPEITNIRQRVREPSEKVKLTTAQKPPQGASGAPRRGRSTRWHNPTNNQPTY